MNPSASFAQWQARVTRELAGAAFESLVARGDDGLDIQPLYPADADLEALDLQTPEEPSGLPGRWPYVRGARTPGGGAPGWELAQEYAQASAGEVRRALLEDLEGGANGLALCLDREGRGLPRAAADGFALRDLHDLEAAFDGAELPLCALRLEAGGNALPAGALLVALLRQRGIATFDLALDFGLDPLGACARDGGLPAALAELEREAVELAHWCTRQAPSARVLCASAVPFSRAGAHAVQELAFALAAALEYLRWLERGGLALDRAAQCIGFSFELDADLFGGIAKLRAARLLWAKTLAACGLAQPPAPWIRALTSERMLARRDPWNNALRNTLASFAAIAGGADSLAVRPHDSLLAGAGALGRRVARNTSHILAEEAHLAELVDPAGGSHYVEARTRALARAAWELVREIEGRGGLAKELLEDSLRARVDQSWSERRARLARRRQPVLGVSEYPPDEPLPRAAPSPALEPRARAALHVPRLPEMDRKGSRFEALVAAAQGGASLADLTRTLERRAPPRELEPYPLRRDAALFEELCEAAAQRPQAARVLLCKLGDRVEHGPRANFARQLFRAGGFAIEEREFPTRDSLARPGDLSAPVLVLCGSDERYLELALDAVRAFKSGGAARILLAGKPGALESELGAAGLEAHFALGHDLHALLSNLLGAPATSSSLRR